MELDSLHCISQIEIYRQNTKEAAPLFNWGAIQPPLDHNFLPNLHLRVILPIIITPLNCIIKHVDIATSNTIIFVGTEEFLVSFLRESREKFAILHQSSPREGGFFPENV